MLTIALDSSSGEVVLDDAASDEVAVINAD